MLTVWSEQALTSLERECGLQKTRQKNQGIWYACFCDGGFAGDLLSGTPARVKFIFLPCLVMLSVLGLAALEGDPGAAWGALCLLGELAVILGWVWLIPAGAAAMFMAERKSSFGVKAVTAAMPVICIAYGCRWYEIHYYFDDLYIYLMLAAVFLPAALPFLMIDEAACIRLKRVTGSRPGARAGAVCWAISLALSAGVIGLEYHLMNWDRYYFTSDVYHALTRANERYDEAQSELAAVRYKDELEAVAMYAAENNYYNWAECPDRSLEEQWQRVFLEAGADYDVWSCEGYAAFKFPGIDHEVKVTTDGSEEGRA